MTSSHHPAVASATRRKVLGAGLLLLAGCQKTETPHFHGVDITGANYARDFQLLDADNRERTLAGVSLPASVGGSERGQNFQRALTRTVRGSIGWMCRPSMPPPHVPLATSRAVHDA